MKKTKMLIVGSINMDIIANKLLFDDPESMTDVYDNHSWKCGGKGLNQACTIAKLGCESVLVGSVGRDYPGQIALDALRESGVDTRYVKICEDCPTGIAFLRVQEDGTYRLSHSMAAINRIEEKDLQRALDQNSYDMVFMQFEMPQQMVYKTYQLAQKRKIPVILDAGPPRPWSLDELRGIFMISPNATEALALSGVLPVDEKSATEAGRIIWEKVHPSYVLIKMGAQGAFVYSDGIGKMIPTFDWVKPVDSTGCGDVFTACVGMQMCQGVSIEEAVRYGNAAASISCTRYGGLSSIPSQEEIAAFLRIAKEREEGGVEQNRRSTVTAGS